MFRRVLIRIIFLFIGISFFKESSSESLIFDLSDRFIEISKDNVKPDFTIFGFTDSESSLVLKIRGPNQKVILQNKKKIFGMWSWNKLENLFTLVYFITIQIKMMMKSILKLKKIYLTMLNLLEKITTI